MKNETIRCSLLCTFAEGACEGADTAAVNSNAGVKEAKAAAVPLTGDTNQAAAAALPTGDMDRQAAAAERERSFEALIRGEYKDLYDARVSETVRRRLGAARESEAKLTALAPTAALLTELLGADPNDADAIGKRIKGLLALEREGSEKRAAVEQDGEARYALWQREARELAARYRGFDVERELSNGTFRAMLEAGVAMRHAYFAVHADELLPATLAHAVKTAREQITASVRNGSVRVSEEGLSPGAGFCAKNDVSRLSRAEREAIIRRVAKGEKISF